MISQKTPTMEMAKQWFLIVHSRDSCTYDDVSFETGEDRWNNNSDDFKSNSLQSLIDAQSVLIDPTTMKHAERVFDLFMQNNPNVTPRWLFGELGTEEQNKWLNIAKLIRN